MKKTYLKPQFKVVDMKGRPKLLVGSNKRVTTVHSNLRTLDDPDEDDIDKQLRREIQAVKNGQNLVM